MVQEPGRLQRLLPLDPVHAGRVELENAVVGILCQSLRVRSPHDKERVRCRHHPRVVPTYAGDLCPRAGVDVVDVRGGGGGGVDDDHAGAVRAGGGAADARADLEGDSAMHCGCRYGT